MPPAKRTEPAPATESTIVIRGQVGPATVEISIKGMERRPLFLLLDELLEALEGERERDE